MGYYVPCDYCGKIVYKPPYQYKTKTNHFCSLECSGKFVSAQKHEYRKCEVCGKEMYVLKTSKYRFCSPKCQSIWQRGNTGIKNPKFEGVVSKCETCGKEISIGKSDLRLYKHHFCSNECRVEWYNNICSQTEEWRNISRERASKQQSTNPRTTKPQLIMNDILDSLGIKYCNEKNVKYYSIDNYLTEYDLAIEVMGDYWHTSPLKYDAPINDIQKRIVSKDKTKRDYVKKYYGINILYVWESDLYKREELCKALIALYIEKLGVLENYHSFNYSIVNGDIKLNEELVLPHQDRNKPAC